MQFIGKKMVVYPGPITTPSRHTTSILFLLLVVLPENHLPNKNFPIFHRNHHLNRSPALGTFPTFLRKTKPLLGGGTGVGDTRSAAQDLEVQRRCNSSDQKKQLGNHWKPVNFPPQIERQRWKLTNLPGFKRKIIFQSFISRFHVNFKGYKNWKTEKNDPVCCCKTSEAEGLCDLQPEAATNLHARHNMLPNTCLTLSVLHKLFIDIVIK